MRRWQGASQRTAREVPVRWIIRGGKEQLLTAVRSYCSWLDARLLRPPKPRVGRPVVPAPRIAIGLFAAADLLGVGFVRGVAPYIYLEHLNPGTLERARPLGRRCGRTAGRIHPSPRKQRGGVPGGGPT